jgi:hypothetical protein
LQKQDTSITLEMLQVTEQQLLLNVVELQENQSWLWFQPQVNTNDLQRPDLLSILKTLQALSLTQQFPLQSAAEQAANVSQLKIPRSHRFWPEAENTSSRSTCCIKSQCCKHFRSQQVFFKKHNAASSLHTSRTSQLAFASFSKHNAASSVHSAKTSQTALVSPAHITLQEHLQLAACSAALLFHSVLLKHTT